MSKKHRDTLKSYAWSAPSLILIGLMVVFPILYTGYISLTNMNVYHWFDFTIVGLDNYIRALFVFDSGFLSALGTICVIVLGVAIAYLAFNAYMRNRIRARRRKRRAQRRRNN